MKERRRRYEKVDERDDVGELIKIPDDYKVVVVSQNVYTKCTYILCPCIKYILYNNEFIYLHLQDVDRVSTLHVYICIRVIIIRNRNSL